MIFGISILTWIYLLIIVFLLVFIIWNMITEKDVLRQIDAALVIIPLLLRLFLVK
ncbi:MAG: hypothetical protein IJU01_03605 [Lachnospiraceae bacterium]|nr:hypothetical protein [Lachnospiraceae bacterium]MBR6271475.1 hypothetical protein [Lachnospiraceae bacterium]